MSDRDQITKAGFDTKHTRGHVRIGIDGRQCAVYRATREGDFAGWGWVEIPNGRTDQRTFEGFMGALGKHERRRNGLGEIG